MSKIIPQMLHFRTKNIAEERKMYYVVILGLIY